MNGKKKLQNEMNKCPTIAKLILEKEVLDRAN
jgi:hypothetical protein